MRLTDQQQAVVDAPKNNILVSAAAGSGKTMVLVERISSRIAEGELDIRKTLVMTFTQAAASSMTDKMEKALIKKMNETIDIDIKRRIAEQISFLPLAQISTIHSFCTQVIREYGNEMRDRNGELLLEPGSSVLDNAMASIMLSDAIDEIMDRIFNLCYEVKMNVSGRADVQAAEVVWGPYADFDFAKKMMISESLKQWCDDFTQMCKCFGSASDDQEIKNLFNQVYLNLRSLPDYEDRMAQAVFDYKKEASDFIHSSRVQYALMLLRNTVKRALSDAIQAQKMLEYIEIVKDKKQNKVYQDNMESLLKCFFRLNDAVDQGICWDDAHAMGKDVPEVSWPRKSKSSDEQVVFLDCMNKVCEALYMISGVTPQKAMKNEFDEHSQYFFFMPAAQYQQDLSQMAPMVSRFFETMYLIDRQYALKKRAENSIDFSDQEQMCLTLLKNEEISDYYRTHFDEIYIDEYQDNSKIQDAIVACFSNQNVFFVGDVKQSIYRFRHARPDMFMARLDQYKNETDGQLLELNGNFRSDKAIIESVNSIFSEIMSVETGEIEYDQKHMLVPMKLDEEKSGHADKVQVVLIDVSDQKNQQEESEDKDKFEEQHFDLIEDLKSTDNGNFDANSSELIEELKSSEKEGLYVANKIIEMMDNNQAKLGDFAILTRTNSDARQIANMLNIMGIPAQSPEDDSLFMHRELLLMQQMISLIDNFRQDLPLSAVMRAPFPQTNFSCADMLCIYLFAQNNELNASSFYEKVLYFEEYGPMPLQKKISDFMSFILDLRRLSVHLNVSELIEQIYLRTNYFEYLSTLEYGKERINALEIFREWANRFEKNKKGDLYAFVRFTEEIRNRQSSSDECEIFTKKRNAVQCLSIHKSKGLEYKNVFVCGINRTLRRRGKIYNALFFDDRYGVVCDCVFPEESYKYTPLNKSMVEQMNKHAEFAEMLRLLYVAATRAEERLFFVGAFNRKKDGGISGVEKLLQRAGQDSHDKLSTSVIRSAKSFLSLLLLVLQKNTPAALDVLSIDPSLSDKEAGFVDINIAYAPFSLSVIDDSGLIYKDAAPMQDVKRESANIESIELKADDKDFWSEQVEQALELRLFKKYDYEKLVHTPAKTTVSEIKRRVAWVEEDESEHEQNIFAPSTSRPINLQVRKEPIKEGKEILSPAERGTLLHSVFQYLDFSAFADNVSAQAVVAQLERIISANMIRKDKLKHVMPYVDSIVFFAQSSLCKRMLAAESAPRSGPFREMPFSITEKVSKDDFCLIQGMIDCWFVEAGQAVLLDYKSDQIMGNVDEKAKVLRERYSVQMEYYARAIEAAGGVKVKEKWIWLIPDGLSFLF